MTANASENNTVVGRFSTTEPWEMFGLAVDLGTTTVAMDLVNLNSDQTVTSAVTVSQQRQFGSDVVSRLNEVYTHPANTGKVRQAAVSTLNELIVKMGGENGLPQVRKIVIAGNTAMNHLLLGQSIRTLAISPFEPEFITFPPFPAKELGLQIPEDAEVYIVPNIKSFVGGDITAGIIATGLFQLPGNHLLIDLGTNGEIVLKNGGTITVTSTAAGPAFEGMNISRGMLALPGAIYQVENGRSLICRTIDNKPPKGICGTGLIDLLATLLDRQVISPEGRINTGETEVKVTRDIALTQKDVQELLLAVAAIKTGIRMMLQKAGIKPENLDSLLVSGAFGSHLNINNSLRIGLLPPLPANKIRLVGNSSLAGARKLLNSDSMRRNAEKMIEKIEHCNLAMNPEFQECFVDALQFEGNLFYS